MVIPSIVVPSGAGRLKVSCSFSYCSGIKNKQSNTQLSQGEGGEKSDYTFMGTRLFNLLFSQWNLPPKVCTWGPKETEGGTWKKETVYLGQQNNNGKSNEVVPVWGLSVIFFFFFTVLKTWNNRGRKWTFASFLVTVPYTLLDWFDCKYDS